MVLLSRVDKGRASGWALAELSISLHDVVSAGDAENDLPFLRISGYSAAVANALPSVKEQADVVLATARGPGVTEVINRLIADDFAEIKRSPRRLSMLPEIPDGRSEGTPGSLSQHDAGGLPGDDAETSALAIGEPAE